MVLSVLFRPQYITYPVDRLKTATTLLLICLLTSACVYRLDVQQGNDIDPGTVEQLEIGMSKSQVEFLLGSPALIDATRPDQWHYINYYKSGEDGSTQSSTLTLRFEADILSDIEGDLKPRQ